MPFGPDTTDWLICTACGTQFPTADREKQSTCFICDDPRQFTPPTGQAFTTLGEMRSPRGGFKNVFVPYDKDDRITFIYTTPKFAIGQRCALIRTPAGNILWDCITLLDNDTIAHINSLGGIAAIAISHPHYYTTHLLWAQTFVCPTYLAAEDATWLAQSEDDYPAAGNRIFLPEGTTELAIELPLYDDPDPAATALSGATLLKPGGHFPGSMVLHFSQHLLIADTLVTTPSGLGSWTHDARGRTRDEDGARSGRGKLRGRPEGMNSFAFMWSIPNMIPLAPDEIARMWEVLRRVEFASTHGAFMGQDVEDERVKERVLESMKTQVAHMGWPEHAFLKMEV